MIGFAATITECVNHVQRNKQRGKTGVKQLSDVFEGGRQGRPQVLNGFEIRCAHNKVTRESLGHDGTQPDRVRA